MKEKIFISLLLTMALIFTNCQKAKQDTIKISGAWALYPMMNVWATEYQKDHSVKIEVAGGGAGKGLSDVLNEQVDIAMVSRPIKQEEIDQGAFFLSVTKDAVIATINSQNPILENLFKEGLSREELKAIFLKEITHWGELIGEQLEDDKIVVYGRADASGAAKVWASFLGDFTQSDLQEVADANFSGDQALCNGVKGNKNSIGFNNLNYAYDVEKGTFAENIRPLPIDLNNNNILDSNENFYHKRSELVKNVSSGTYPSPPSRLEYVVAKNSYQSPAREFIFWILTEGQKHIENNGYVQLPLQDIQQEIEFLKLGYRK